MASETHPSICRFCHANCGILVEVEEGRPVRVEGDPENPAYFGFTCAKGRRLPEQHSHPDRLLYSQRRRPQKRQGEGEAAAGKGAPSPEPRDLPAPAVTTSPDALGFDPISSEQAMDEVSARVAELIERYGPRSVALYVGTYSGPHPASIPAAVGWMLGIGSKMVFTSSAIDQPGKHVANAIHGRWLGGSHVFDESDVWMLIGNNPLISMSGGIPPSNPSRRLREAKKRGLKLIVIDPRKTEVARFADVFLQPRAGEDASLLAAMLHVVFRERLYDAGFIEAETTGFAELEEAVARFTPECVAKRADVDAADIERAARLFAEGPRGCGVAGTGTNMSPHGNLSEYLLLALNTVCGRWRREGEAVANPGALLPRATPKAQAMGPRAGWGKGEGLKSRDLVNSAAGLPTAALADEILYEGEDRIRALVCLGSNPVAAWPDQLKTIRAMESLELLVTLDMKMSATSKFADYVIAPKLSLEVPGLSISSEAIEQTYVAMGYSEPYAQYSEAIARPPADSDVLEEWEFFYGLAQRAGFPLACHPIRPETGVLRERRESVFLDMEKKPTTDELFEAMMAESRIPLEELKRHPHGAIFDDETIRVAPADPDATDRLDIGNADMLDELNAVFEEEEDQTRFPGRPLRLISRRMPNVYNSSGRDIDALQKGRPYNPAFLHPKDLEAAGVDSGDLIEIASDHGRILGIAKAAPELRRGVLSMAHCYGEGPESDPAYRALGSNTGRLIDNERDFDPHTGIPRMSAIPVSITRIESGAA